MAPSPDSTGMKLESRTPNDGSRPSHPILFRAVAILLGLALGWGVIELAFRFFWAPAPAMPPRQHAASPKEPALVPATPFSHRPTPWFHRFGAWSVNMRSLNVPFTALDCDSQTGPGGQATCTQARHNSHGFRMPEYTIARPPDTFRIVIVGDSFTWGDGIDMEETYHRQLQKRFDASASPSSPRIEVIALGVNGSSIFDNAVRLFVHGQSLNPDLVLVQFFDNDLGYRGSPAMLEYSQGEGHLDFFLNATRVGKALRESARDQQLWRLAEVEMSRQYDGQSLEWRLFQTSLATLERWTKDTNVPVAFVSFPAVDKSPGGRNFDRFRSPPSSMRLLEKAEAEIESHGFALLRILETFRARAGETFLAVSRTNGHYGPAASRMVADAIAEFLRSASWVDLASPRERKGSRGWPAEEALRRRAGEKWADYHQSYELQKKFFTDLIQLHPADPWVTDSLAFVLREQGDREGARKLYRRLADLAPRNFAPWYDLALCAADGAQRERLLIQMLDAVPDHPAAVEALASLDAMSGRAGRSCDCYRRLLELSQYPAQYGRAVDGLRKHDCDRATGEPCPGRDPLEWPRRVSELEGAAGSSADRKPVTR